MARPEKIRLGDLLIQQGLLTGEQLNFALDEQKRSGRKPGRIVVESAFVQPARKQEYPALCLYFPWSTGFLFSNCYDRNIGSQVRFQALQSPPEAGFKPESVLR
jgi:hypothetical protein